MSASSDPAAPSPRRIPLRVANKTAYVWDVDDIATIRAQHRICGVLTGTLPHLAQQNVFLGVPLVLLPEEAALLVDTGAAVFVDDPRAHAAPPTEEELGAWQTLREGEREREVEGRMRGAVAGEGGAEGKGKAESEAAMRKRRDREERRRKKMEEGAAARARGEGGETAPVLDVFAPSSTTTSEPSTSTSAIEPSSSTRPPGTSASPNTPTTTSTANTHPYTITVPAPSSTLAWYAPASHTYATIDAARAAGVWDYPATLAERARCGVFKDLWRQGYFMGGGIKFGGEYLVYPGDPLRYHSHFAASVVESPVAKLRPMEIVAHGRLGTATKKAHLLCGWDDEKQEVSYLSIEWAGFG